MKPDNQLINNRHPPRSVAQLIELANVLMDPNLPIKAYIQSCSLLYQRAMASMSENNLELAFIYLLRAARVLVEDLPSKHPDYPLLPPNFQASLQADGHRYINELAPLKARLSQRHSEYIRQSSTTSSVKTANSSSKSRINFRPLKSSNPPVSSASRSLLYSDIRKTTSSSQKFNSTPPLSQSSSIDPLKLYNSSTQNLKQSISPPSSPSHLNSNKTSLDDWQLMDDSDLHPNQKIPKTSRHQLSGSSDRNQSIWPVELGDGRGKRMSVAMPALELNEKPKPHVSALFRSAGLQNLYNSGMPSTDELSTLLNNDPLSGKSETRSHSVVDRHYSHPTHPSRLDNSIRRPQKSRSLEPQSNVDAYQQVDQILAQAAQDNCVSVVSTPLPEPGLNRQTSLKDSFGYTLTNSLSSQALSVPGSPSGPTSHPHRSRKLSILVRKFGSSENVTLSKQPKPVSHSPNPDTSTGKLKALISPRFLFSSSNLSSSSVSSMPVVNSSSPTSQYPANAVSYGNTQQIASSKPPRRRKSSLGDISTWRWLKSLQHKSSAPSQASPDAVNARSSAQRDLYSETDTTPSSGLQSRSGACSSIFSPPPSSSSSYSSNLVYPQQRDKDAIRSSASLVAAKISGLDLANTTTDAGRAAVNKGYPPTSAKVHHLNGTRPPEIPPKLPLRTRAGSLDIPSKSLLQSWKQSEGELRPMICPSDLIGTFVAIATPETERGVELCGLLLGRQTKRNALVITTLLIPKQVSTSDTCATTDEDETFRYQDQENLMTLGWIHTHPTQTCFMSSVDLHTHASYQLMMAEAVAIVCSPKKNPSVGFFRLTYPIGLETIVNCKLPGLFHPHPSGVPIYTDADRGGHFKLEQSLELDVVDLRD